MVRGCYSARQRNTQTQAKRSSSCLAFLRPPIHFFLQLQQEARYFHVPQGHKKTKNFKNTSPLLFRFQFAKAINHRVPVLLTLPSSPSPQRLFLPLPSRRRLASQGVTEANLLASVCKRYRTVKTLIIKPDGLVAPASTCANATPQQPLGKKAAPASDSDSSSTTFVEITFAGPQPSENCGALLCLLLGGDSVQAWPVELPRGRKRKNTGSSTSEASAEEISEGRTFYSIFKHFYLSSTGCWIPGTHQTAAVCIYITSAAQAVRVFEQMRTAACRVNSYPCFLV